MSERAAGNEHGKTGDEPLESILACLEFHELLGKLVDFLIQLIDLEIEPVAQPLVERGDLAT
jgi:hypothetical protein